MGVQSSGRRNEEIERLVSPTGHQAAARHTSLALSFSLSLSDKSIMQ